VFLKFSFENHQFLVTHPVSYNLSLLKASEVQFYSSHVASQVFSKTDHEQLVDKIKKNNSVLMMTLQKDKGIGNSTHNHSSPHIFALSSSHTSSSTTSYRPNSICGNPVSPTHPAIYIPYGSCHFPLFRFSTLPNPR